MVFKSLVTGGKALAATVGGFFAGLFGWSASQESSRECWTRWVS
ncbi:hypothetical protein [Halorussus sp. MSC15.2]|nr:hypothetical protein [Halorussus sp. MSC15.2]